MCLFVALLFPNDLHVDCCSEDVAAVALDANVGAFTVCVCVRVWMPLRPITKNEKEQQQRQQNHLVIATKNKSLEKTEATTTHVGLVWPSKGRRAMQCSAAQCLVCQDKCLVFLF